MEPQNDYIGAEIATSFCTISCFCNPELYRVGQKCENACILLNRLFLLIKYCIKASPHFFPVKFVKTSNRHHSFLIELKSSKFHQLSYFYKTNKLPLSLDKALHQKFWSNAQKYHLKNCAKCWYPPKSEFCTDVIRSTSTHLVLPKGVIANLWMRSHTLVRA